MKHRRPVRAAWHAPAADRVRRACDAIARAPERRWPVARIAAAGETSVIQIQRAFKSVLGMSPRDYVAACRRQRFLSRLREGRGVSDAIYAAGYGSSSRVYGDAIRLPGMTPATYGRGGEGARIDWLTAISPLGRVLVAATGRGVCFVEIAESEALLLKALRNEFPRAEIGARPSARLRPVVEAAGAVASAIDLPRDLAVDIRGTAFQWRVWRALTTIPRGATHSYSELASMIGAPTATRAVASACAANPLALLVPCHRITPRAGGVGGYRWGPPVKAALLESERHAPRRHQRRRAR